MKVAFLPIVFLVGLITSAVAQQSDEDIIRESITTYWKSFSSKDFSKVAAYILPEDLAGVKKEILPVFIEAARSQNDELKKLAAAFFGQTPESEWTGLAPETTYECLNRFIDANMPQLFEILKTSTITVDRVELNEARATIHYQIKMKDQTTNDSESYVKKDGKWWLRVKEDPKDTAKNLREAFGLGAAKTPAPAPEAEKPNP